MEEMSARREQKYSDWENAWDLTLASVFPTCGRWQSWPAWEGHSEQAIGHLREAAELAADLGLPGEQWQIQAALGTLYEAGAMPDASAHRLGFGRQDHPGTGTGYQG